MARHGTRGHDGIGVCHKPMHQSTVAPVANRAAPRVTMALETASESSTLFHRP